MNGIFVDGKQIGTITIPNDDFAHIVAQNKIVELRDDTGRTVMRYEIQDSLLNPEPSIPVEELLRRGREPGGMSLTEFWKSKGQA